tara:strand:- start:516 stop:851 length:336 start_codon:yes stop_codon:yes gene_type:complete
MKFEDSNIFKKLFNQYDSQREKVTSSLKELKLLLASESKESLQILDVYYKYIAGENISKEELAKANDKLEDILKGIGALGIFALPGGILAIAFLVKLGKKYGVDILPKKKF